MTAYKRRSASKATILRAATAAARAVPPLWPLAESVAVNPFLGQTGEHLAAASARLAKSAGCRLTMDRDWYKKKLENGEIADGDLEAALLAAQTGGHGPDLAAVRSELDTQLTPVAALPTVADIAADVSDADWPDLVADMIGTWAGAYFDQGQAFWPAPRGGGAWRSWREYASRDLRPEIAGLDGFAAHVVATPLEAADAIVDAAKRLKLSADAMELYFHRLLMAMGGWAQVARYRLWQAELNGEQDDDLIQLLAIRLCWEAVLLGRYEREIGKPWSEAVTAYAEPVSPSTEQITDSIFQEAAERAGQRSLIGKLSAASAAINDGRPALHVAFCIDVRSEVFRRALETADVSIRTAGFAGFFGIAAEYKAAGSDTPEARCPVLLKPAHQVAAASKKETPAAESQIRISARAKRAWGRFKLAAVSSFSFVESAGLIYAPRLVRDALSLVAPKPPAESRPVFESELTVEERIHAAATILQAMSMTDGFARLVVFAGHGAGVVNNPHASALQCGACGGYSGETNARLLAALLNDQAVRSGLAEQGIDIPADTLFLGALHDTTTDTVTLFDGDTDTAAHRSDIDQAKKWFAQAGKIARTERAIRLPHAGGADQLLKRSRDWSEIRPEWGLAGCQAFIAAPRHRTSGQELAGRAFLNDYDWRKDKDFSVLELILTAPVVVASWISLQYYGSVVAPDVFGAGNKLLHNVSGGMGVLEGNGGVLRGGLPWQSVHDGDRFVHEPLRLSVFIEAPTDAIEGVLKKHPDVRNLFDHRWLHLFAIDDQESTIRRYSAVGAWVAETNGSEGPFGKAA